MSKGCGRLAQLVERLPYKQDVTGSSPVLPIEKPGLSAVLMEHLNVSDYPKISSIIHNFRDVLGMDSDEITGINNRLKAARIPVRVRLNGSRLVLRATLPRKEGDGMGTKQYDISLGLPANKDGLRRIEIEDSALVA